MGEKMQSFAKTQQKSNNSSHNNIYKINFLNKCGCKAIGHCVSSKIDSEKNVARNSLAQCEKVVATTQRHSTLAQAGRLYASASWKALRERKLEGFTRVFIEEIRSS
jgi:hypothetical protein